MNLSQIIHDISIQYSLKIIIMIVILLLSTPFLLIITIYYKRLSDPIFKQRFEFKISTIKDFFNDTFMNEGQEKTSFFLKYFIFIQILSILYVVYYPVNSSNAFIVFFIYATVNILMFSLDYLSETKSHIQFQTGKNIRLIFENFFLVLIILTFLKIMNEIPDKNELVRNIKFFLAILIKSILFILLFLLRENLSVDLFRIRKRWISRFSKTGENYFKISDQLAGTFLIIFFMNVSFTQNSWFLEITESLISAHYFSVFKWSAATLFFLFADISQRQVLNCLTMPEERYLIKLNNLVFFPIVIVSILIIVSLK